MARTKKEKKTDSKPRRGLRLVLNTAMVLFIVFCTVSIVTMQNSIVEKKKKLTSLQEEIDTLQAHNDELEALIESDDIGRYMEKLALESNGYAYPDERRYYDTSRSVH